MILMHKRPDISSAAVERALEILETLAHRERGLTNSELSRRLAIPKSSASYLLRTLEARGYLKRERLGGRYRLGLKVLNLGQGVQPYLELRRVALPVLNRLARDTGITVHLAVLDHGEAVYVERVEGSGSDKPDTWVGRRIKLHSTAVGKAIAAHLPACELESAIAEHGLKMRTFNTITSDARLMHELEKVRALGFAVDDEENNTGARCVAAAVLDGFGRIIGALGVCGTTMQIERSSLRRKAESIIDAARELSAQLSMLSAER